MTRDTLVRRLFLILLIGAALSAAAALWLSDAAYRRRQADEGRTDAAARIVSALQVLPSGATYPGVNRARDTMPEGAVDETFTRRLDETLGLNRAVAYLAPPDGCRPVPPTPPGLAATPPRPDAPPPSGPAPKADVRPAALRPGGPLAVSEARNCRLVVIRTADAPLSLTVALPTDPASLTAGRFGLVFLSVLALAAALLAWITARLAIQPLRRLSAAATSLGEDLNRPRLPLDGPEEVRQAAAAFNSMQARLKDAMADRTRMLAAITHDLQTPLTRMRLRLDKIADVDLRDRLLADFAATQVLIREGLDLAHDAESGEAWGQVDVPSLIEALVEDMADAGLPVRITDSCSATVRARPQALRRALGNLIDNAIKHGGSAEVTSALSPGGDVTISVRDHGPGIPDDELGAVLEPFHRLEQSRSRASGGSGLGLTIAVRLAQRTGATLKLVNHPKGGLQAQITFNGRTER